MNTGILKLIKSNTPRPGRFQSFLKLKLQENFVLDERSISRSKESNTPRPGIEPGYPKGK